MTEPKNKVEQQIECATCPWDRFCIRPPMMTKEEVEREIKDKMKPDKEDKGGESTLFGGLMATMIYGGKDKECPACPVFIEELRKGPELSKKIKELMKGK